MFAGAFVCLAGFLCLLLIIRRQVKLAKRRSRTDAVTGGLSADGFCAAAKPLLSHSASQYAVVTVAITNLLQLQQTFGQTNRVLVHI